MKKKIFNITTGTDKQILMMYCAWRNIKIGELIEVLLNENEQYKKFIKEIKSSGLFL